MKKYFLKICVFTLMAVLVLNPAFALENNEPAPDFTLVDPSGQEHSLSDYASKYVVLEWVNFGCPFVKKHYDSGNMQSLQKELTQDGVVWVSINSSAEGKQGNLTDEEINAKIKMYGGAQTAYLKDPDGKVGRLYGAQTTPHMFLISPGGDIIYQGAIDSIASADKDDVSKAENYVRKAYNAAKAGKQISPAKTKSYGCSVKY